MAETRSGVGNDPAGGALGSGRRRLSSERWRSGKWGGAVARTGGSDTDGRRSEELAGRGSAGRRFAAGAAMKRGPERGNDPAGRRSEKADRGSGRSGRMWYSERRSGGRQTEGTEASRSAEMDGGREDRRRGGARRHGRRDLAVERVRAGGSDRWKAETGRRRLNRWRRGWAGGLRMDARRPRSADPASGASEEGRMAGGTVIGGLVGGFGEEMSYRGFSVSGFGF